MSHENNSGLEWWCRKECKKAKICDKCEPICKGQFKKVIEFSNSGLALYAHSDRNETKTGNAPDRSFVLYNSSGRSINKLESSLEELSKYNSQCCTCSDMLNKIYKLLTDIKIIEKNEVLGICEHCNLKGPPIQCEKCIHITNKFLLKRVEQIEYRHNQLKQWSDDLKKMLLAIIQQGVISKRREEASKYELKILLRELQKPRTYHKFNIRTFPESEIEDAEVEEEVEREKKILTKVITILESEKLSMKGNLEKALGPEFIKNMPYKILGNLGSLTKTKLDNLLGSILTDKIIEKILHNFGRPSKEMMDQVLGTDLTRQMIDKMLDNVGTLTTEKAENMFGFQTTNRLIDSILNKYNYRPTKDNFEKIFGKYVVKEKVTEIFGNFKEKLSRKQLEKKVGVDEATKMTNEALNNFGRLKLEKLEKIAPGDVTKDILNKLLFNIGKLTEEKLTNLFDPDIAKKYINTILSNFGDSLFSKRIEEQLGSSLAKEVMDKLLDILRREKSTRSKLENLLGPGLTKEILDKILANLAGESSTKQKLEKLLGYESPATLMDKKIAPAFEGVNLTVESLEHVLGSEVANKVIDNMLANLRGETVPKIEDALKKTKQSSTDFIEKRISQTSFSLIREKSPHRLLALEKKVVLDDKKQDLDQESLRHKDTKKISDGRKNSQVSREPKEGLNKESGGQVSRESKLGSEGRKEGRPKDPKVDLHKKRDVSFKGETHISKEPEEGLNNKIGGQVPKESKLGSEGKKEGRPKDPKADPHKKRDVSFKGETHISKEPEEGLNKKIGGQVPKESKLGSEGKKEGRPKDPKADLHKKRDINLKGESQVSKEPKEGLNKNIPKEPRLSSEGKEEGRPKKSQAGLEKKVEKRTKKKRNEILPTESEANLAKTRPTEDVKKSEELQVEDKKQESETELSKLLRKKKQELEKQQKKKEKAEQKNITNKASYPQKQDFEDLLKDILRPKKNENEEDSKEKQLPDDKIIQQERKPPKRRVKKTGLGADELQDLLNEIKTKSSPEEGGLTAEANPEEKKYHKVEILQKKDSKIIDLKDMMDSILPPKENKHNKKVPVRKDLFQIDVNALDELVVSDDEELQEELIEKLELYEAQEKHKLGKGKARAKNRVISKAVSDTAIGKDERYMKISNATDKKGLKTLLGFLKAQDKEERLTKKLQEKLEKDLLKHQRKAEKKLKIELPLLEQLKKIYAKEIKGSVIECATTPEEREEMIKGTRVVPRKLLLPQKDRENPLFFKTKPTGSSSLTLHEVKLESSVLPEREGKGILRYQLSNPEFIRRGWTKLPTLSTVRQMNIYKMCPTKPAYDWFNRHKNKGMLFYETGEKLAEIDQDGHGRWYYKNGVLALDFYKAEEKNIDSRYVVYSSGERDENGNPRAITVLASFDLLGNGIVYDHTGHERIKYNQTEGILFDEKIGPLSKWKWHQLNDSSPITCVMFEDHGHTKNIGDVETSTQSPQESKSSTKKEKRSPSIARESSSDEMLLVERENFVKRNQNINNNFRTFKIKPKNFKINDYFSLHIIDQRNISLMFRDGQIALKQNLGLTLNNKEIIDTEPMNLGEVITPFDRPKSESVENLISILETTRAKTQSKEWSPEKCKKYYKVEKTLTQGTIR